VDFHDACGAHISVHAKQWTPSPYDDSADLSAGGDRIVRVLPRANENINQEFISDKTRFGFEGV